MFLMVSTSEPVSNWTTTARFNKAVKNTELRGPDVVTARRESREKLLVINTFTENIHKPNKQKIGLVWCQLGKDCREAVELHAEKSGLLVGSFIKTIIKIRIIGHMINLLWAWKNQHVFCKMSLINQRTGKANQTPGLGCFSIYGIFKFSNSFRQGPLPQLLKTTDLSWSEK